MLIRKDILRQLAAVEVVRQEPQYIPVMVIYFEVPPLTDHQIPPQLHHQVGMPVELLLVRKVIVRQISQSSPSVESHRLRVLLLRQLLLFSTLRLDYLAHLVFC